MKTLIVATLLTAVPFTVYAQDQKAPSAPQSLKAKEAIEKHQKSSDKAREEYYATLVSLDEQYVKDLDAALRAAANSTDVAEIARIAQARKDAQLQLQGDKAATKTPTVTMWELTDKDGKVWQITLRANGQAQSDPGNIQGRWERRGNQLFVKWTGNIDRWTLSDDGFTFVGSDSHNYPFHGTMLGSTDQQ